MKKYNALSIIILISVFIMCLPMSAYANSSWHWITTSPMTLLPFVIILTLIIEIVSVVKFGKVKNLKKVFYVVALANLLSYLAPYIERAYRFIPTSGGFNFAAAFNKGPYYIVLIGYLLLTIIVELPVTFFILRKDTENAKMLAISILGANIITTLMVAIIERVVCVGQW